jgi:hypothetical protein
MPRFVRPAWMTLEADGRPVATGPRSLDGWLLANLTVRTLAGDVSESVRITARTNRMEVEWPHGWSVLLDRDATGRYFLVATPPAV